MNIPNLQQTSNLKSTGVVANKQIDYKDRCERIEYHIREAYTLNKALQLELKEIQNKIEFEKRLKKDIKSRIKNLESR